MENQTENRDIVKKNGPEGLQQYMNVGFGMRITTFVLAVVLTTAIATVIMSFLLRSGATTPRMRIVTVAQDVLMFILPPLITAIVVCRLPARFILLNKAGRLLPYLAAIIAMIVSIPVMNYIVALNEGIHLPESLSGFEQWMRGAEDQAAASFVKLFGEATVANLIVNLLIVAVLAGLSEELFFRGGIQQLLITRPMNAHAAIWITAILFSALHMQFYGFFPRMILGAWFGYLAWWSRTIWLPVAAHVLNNAVVVCSRWSQMRSGRLGNIDVFCAHPENSAEVVTIIVSLVLTIGAVILTRRSLRGSN